MKYKSQTVRILGCFLTVVVMISSIMLLMSGIAISKMNTDYMETGVRAGKIVAERESRQISLTTHKGLKLSPVADNDYLDKILTYMPVPINTTYLIVKNISEFIDAQSETE